MRRVSGEAGPRGRPEAAQQPGLPIRQKHTVLKSRHWQKAQKSQHTLAEDLQFPPTGMQLAGGGGRFFAANLFWGGERSREDRNGPCLDMKEDGTGLDGI